MENSAPSPKQALWGCGQYAPDILLAFDSAPSSIKWDKHTPKYVNVDGEQIVCEKTARKLDRAGLIEIRGADNTIKVTQRGYDALRQWFGEYA